MRKTGLYGLAGVAAAALIAAPAASASEAHSAQGPTVIQQIRIQDKTIRANPEFKQLRHFTIRTPAQARAAARDFRALGQTFTESATLVAKASATPGQTTGQGDWVRAADELGRGVKELGVAVLDVLHDEKAKAKTVAARADRLIDSANALGDKADRLLGLPTSD